MIALLPWLRALPWKWIGAGLAAAAIWYGIARFEANAYHRGEVAERARWEAAQVEETNRLRMAYDNAAKIAAEARAAREQVFTPIEQEAKAYAAKPQAATVCLDADAAGIVRKAIAAANADVAAAAR